mmetsp:Transcript_26763/g.67124  ORF Transcript_26763/g.67124 Transcript_26763/m.67124 type:complete len:208 (+) Transcript_26763:179-802(+)
MSKLLSTLIAVRLASFVTDAGSRDSVFSYTKRLSNARSSPMDSGRDWIWLRPTLRRRRLWRDPMESGSSLKLLPYAWSSWRLLSFVTDDGSDWSLLFPTKSFSSEARSPTESGIDLSVSPKPTSRMRSFFSFEKSTALTLSKGLQPAMSSSKFSRSAIHAGICVNSLKNRLRVFSVPVTASIDSLSDSRSLSVKPYCCRSSSVGLPA